MRRLLPFLAVLALSAQALGGTFSREVLVLNSAATLVTSTLPGRRAIEIQNQGPNPIYCAVVASSSASTDAVLTKSRKIDAGSAWALDLPEGRFIYCRAGTADQVTGAATDITEVD